MISAIITDLDGTLVDTYEANYLAYERAFSDVGLALHPETYKECFGFRFDKFMLHVGVKDTAISNKIKELKKEYYPQYFDYLRPNIALIELIKTYKNIGLKTAIASTARKENLLNVINFLKISDLFDVILAGEDVDNGKPSPEIYQTSMDRLNIAPEETLIFEDSEVGLKAAQASGAHVIKITLQS